MTDTTTRRRKVEHVVTSQGGAFGLALAMLMAMGIKNTVELNGALDGGDFTMHGDHAPLNEVETVNAYPDRVALLDDSSILICDGTESAAIGEFYSDLILATAPVDTGPTDADLAHARTASMGDDSDAIELHSPGAGEPGYRAPLAISTTPDDREPLAANLAHQSGPRDA